jgi:DNA-binding NarL/FixJ family response regulator
LADDHKIIRDGLRSVLAQESDIQVVAEAENGRQAIKLAKKNKPNVVIMDVSMPDTNGIEATRQIVEDDSEIKVLPLSMHSDRQFIADMLRAGASGYMLKDSAAEELIRAIRTIIKKKVYLSPAIAHLVVEGFVAKSSTSDLAARDILSTRELEVCQLFSEGVSTKKIAFKLNLSIKTVETHRKNIFNKLDIDNIADLTKYAVRNRITSLDP